MSSTASSRTFVSALLLALGGCAAQPRAPQVLFQDDFTSGLANWQIEAEKPGNIHAADGVLDIDVPAGVTLWFKPRLEGPIAIQFEATAVAAGGPNDQISDLNMFWMAHDRDGTEPVYAVARSGKFSEYNNLLTYYVGVGGNRNHTTRFRRYIGDPFLRPLLPEHDLTAESTLLVANRPQKITLIADRGRIECSRDGEILFRFQDLAPYVSGWFALRTTYSHLQIRQLRIYRPTND